MLYKSQQHKYQVSLLLQLLSVFFFSSLELLIISDKTALLLILNRMVVSR